MLLKIMRGKIHRAKVTEAKVDYVGSITIDRELMDAAGLLPGECVLVADLTDGARFETYVFEGEPGSGVICINGAAAHLVQKGDQVIIMAFEISDRPIKPKQILVDADNRYVRDIEHHERGVIAPGV